MRRGSLVLPLLLIAIGTLLLLPNFIPDVPLLDWVARYWPWVLIVWGGLRLIELGMWWAAGKPLPARGLSSGEWVLAFFVAVAGLSIHAARGFYSWLPESGITWGGLEVFGQSYDFPVSGQAAASASPRVVIEGFRGNARINGADVQAVTVTGRNTVRSMDQAGAERANQAAALEVSGDRDQVVINTHQDRVSGGPRVETYLEITVPRGASIVARGRGGDFDVSNLNGNVEIDSERANVRLENIGGEVRLDLRSSDLVRAVSLAKGLDLRGRGSDIDFERVAGPVNVNGSFTGTVQMRSLEMPLHWVGPQTEIALQALPGDLRLTLADLNLSNARGPVRIDSRSKDIWLSGYTDSLDITLGRGDILLEATGAPLGRTTVRTNAGNLELVLPKGARFDLVAATERGDAVNNYGDPLRAEDNGRRGGSIRGSNGGPVIELHTGRGQVLVREGGSPGSGSIFPPVAPRGKAEMPPPAKPVFQ
jgi:hypothetical protein